MNVLKFGGTSVADANAMKIVIDICKKDIENKILVLSACSGITDKLIKLANTAKNINLNQEDKQFSITNDTLPIAINEIYSLISSHHISLIENNIIDPDIKRKALVEINILLNQVKDLALGISYLTYLSDSVFDKIQTYGELLSTKCFHYLSLDNGIDSFWADSRELIIFDPATRDYTIVEEYKNNIFEQINQGKTIVFQGFIAKNTDNQVCTLGRGGSDFSGAILGQCFEANEIQIWTDVSGVLSADPRKFQNTQTLDFLSFDQMRRLAFFGAKVLHPDTILPALNANIPVKILNTFDPNQKGTLIFKDFEKISKNKNGKKPISSILYQSLISKNNLVLTCYTIPYNNQRNELLQFVELIESLDISILYRSVCDDKIDLLLENSNKIEILNENIKLKYENSNIFCNLTFQNVFALIFIGINPNKHEFIRRLNLILEKNKINKFSKFILNDDYAILILTEDLDFQILQTIHDMVLIQI